ncbi:metallopeptidase family protein [Nostocoides veronense]
MSSAAAHRGRDRHGRGPRGPLAWPPVPAMSTRRDRFDQIVLEGTERFEKLLSGRYAGTEFAVEDVPPSDPAPWEERRIVLGRLFPADGGMPARIVVYRRPIEARAGDGRDRADLVREVLEEHVAALLGVAPEDLDAGD